MLQYIYLVHTDKCTLFLSTRQNKIVDLDSISPKGSFKLDFLNASRTCA